MLFRSLNENIRIKLPELEKLVSGSGGAKKWKLIDVRMPDEFKGLRTFGEKRPGHIPGALNIPWTQFVGADGNPLDKDQVIKLLKDHGVTADSEIIFYCTGGVRSGYTTWVALQAGLNARNYDASFWQWSFDNRLSIVK